LIRSHIRVAKEGMLKILTARDAFYQPARSLAEEHSEATSATTRS
jgi:hypothetical protein